MNVDEGIQRIIEKLPGISGIGISGVSKVVVLLRKNMFAVCKCSLSGYVCV